MKNWPLLLVFCCNFLFAQQLQSELLSEEPFFADVFVGVDDFGAVYFVKDDIFYKKTEKVIFQHADLLLGELTHVNLLNPLEILLYYQNANTAVLVDNNLVEIERYNFNQIEPFRSTAYIGLAAENKLWIYNLNLQRLEIFGRHHQRNIPHSTPIEDDILGITSNFNYCWIATSKSLRKYNIYATLIEEYPVEGLTAIEQDNENLIILKEKELLFLKKNASEAVPVKLPDIAIEQFYLKDEILYIYSNKVLYQFRIIS